MDKGRKRMMKKMKRRKEWESLTWNIVGYLKPSTERTYLLTNNPSTRMTMKIEAAPIFILTTHTGAAHKSVSCCHNITRVSIQPACQAGDGSSLYSSGGTSRVTASQASEPPSGVLTAHYGRKEKWISLL